MTDYTQMHVFFTVTTAAVILVTALFCGMIVALIRFFTTLNNIAREVHEEATEIRADLDDLRADVSKGFRFVPWFTFFGKLGKRAARNKKTRKQTRSAK